MISLRHRQVNPFFEQMFCCCSVGQYLEQFNSFLNPLIEYYLSSVLSTTFLNLIPLFKSRGISICPLFSYWVWGCSLSLARTYYISDNRICMFHPCPFRNYPRSNNTYTALREILQRRIESKSFALIKLSCHSNHSPVSSQRQYP